MTGSAQRIGVYGASGSGKSTKARELIVGVTRLVRFDPFAEGARGAVQTDARGFRAALAKNWNAGFNINVVPSYGHEMADLHAISTAIRDAQVQTGARAPITFLAEEINTAFPVTALPAQYPGFGELCSRGRHFNVNIIGVSQRIAEVNTRWRGNTSCFYVFRQGDARDVQAATAMLPPGWRNAVTQLQNFEYLFVNAGHVTRGKVKRR